jgi:hypothetical protein
VKAIRKKAKLMVVLYRSIASESVKEPMLDVAVETSTQGIRTRRIPSLPVKSWLSSRNFSVLTPVYARNSNASQTGPR